MMTGISLSAGVAALWYTYGGYAQCLRLLANTRRHSAGSGAVSASKGDAHTEPVTVYLGLWNEGEIISQRLENILDTTYPLDLLEIFVLADGCTDDTADLVRLFAKDHPEVTVEVVEFEESSGKWRTQNLVAEQAQSSILISTDAETEFLPDTISRLVDHFGDPNVGVVGGQVSYLTPDSPEGSESPGSPVSDGYRLYREMETVIRELETVNGVLTRTDGPCVAYRKEIWRPIERFEDVDQVICILARQGGAAAIHDVDAKAIDFANSTGSQDIKQRSRMCRKTLQTYTKRWTLSNALRDPFFTWALVSHKPVRLLSPVWVLMTGTGLARLSLRVLGWRVSVLGGLAALTAISFNPKLRSLATAFTVAQCGFARGLFDTARGVREGRWEPTRGTTERTPVSQSKDSDPTSHLVSQGAKA